MARLAKWYALSRRDNVGGSGRVAENWRSDSAADKRIDSHWIVFVIVTVTVSAVGIVGERGTTRINVASGIDVVATLKDKRKGGLREENSNLKHVQSVQNYWVIHVH